MDPTIAAALFGLVGVLIGGGMQTFHSWRERKAEAKAALSALVSEVDGLTRLINHRQYLPVLINQAEQCKRLLDNGQTDALMPGLRMSMSHDYLVLFNALASKIGILDPYQADRIVRFYTVVKAATEILLDPEMAEPLPVSERLQLLEADIILVQVLLLIGLEVAGFREIKGPASVIGPLQVTAPPYQFRVLTGPDPTADNPEWSEADFANAKPADAVHSSGIAEQLTRDDRAG